MKLIIEDGIPENSLGYGTQQRLVSLFEDILEMHNRKGLYYGEAWRDQGYMGNVGRVLSKAARLKEMLWRDGFSRLEDSEETTNDTALDMILIAGFFILNLEDGNRWGRGKGDMT